MKTTLRLSLIIAALSFFIASCKKEIKEIGPAFEAGAGIYGSWEINDYTQTDLSLPVPETRSLKGLIEQPTQKLVIRFNTNKTYDIIQAGEFIPGIFGTNGSWDFVSSPFPAAITITSSDNITTILNLKNMVREYDPSLGLSLTRKNSCDKEYVGYDMIFNRIN